jgi:hypothetical protein
MSPYRRVGAALVLAGACRYRLLRWGAAADEATTSLPGDSLLARAHLTATRAISIDAAPGDVWPWVAQIGQGRGGFYSYELLENALGRAGIHNAGRIVPAWQDVRVGDEVKLHPDVPLAVVDVQPGTALVLRGGVPMGSVAAPYDFTWAFCVRQGPDGSSRLIVRERYSFQRWWARPLVESVSLASFVMTTRMLHGIKDRAEGGRPTSEENHMKTALAAEHLLSQRRIAVTGVSRNPKGSAADPFHRFLKSLQVVGRTLPRDVPDEAVRT